MDVIIAYSYGTAAWLILQATPLIVSPKIIVTLLSPEVRQITSLEEYFSRSLGLALLALALLSVVLTGAFPIATTASNYTGSSATATDPYAAATLLITTLYHTSTAFYAYTRYTRSRQTTFMLGVIGSGLIAAMGLWCILFGGQAARISKRTGADKRTSGWPFRNAEADKKKVGRKIK